MLEIIYNCFLLIKIIKIQTPLTLRTSCLISTQKKTRQVTWMKGHDIVRGSDRHTVTGNQLQIKGASSVDVGSYLCLAENVMGATSAFTRITIGIPPKIDRATRRNSTLGKKGRKLVAFNIGISRTIPVGAIVRIYCNSTGLPMPSTSWIVEKGSGQRISRTRVQVIIKI